jgi:hypothetical protein
MFVLVPCTKCRRHVRVTDARCPFCSTAVPRDAAQRAIPPATKRLDRVAMFTFATTLTVAACGGIDSGVGVGDEDGGGGLGAADASGRREGGGPTDDGGINAHYGLPAIDAGERRDASAKDGGSKDAEAKDTGASDAAVEDAAKDAGIAPLYGLPIDDGGGQALYGLAPFDAGED